MKRRQEDTRERANEFWHKFTPYGRAIGVALVAFWFGFMMLEGGVGDDLSDGHIPASDRSPNEHWDYIYSRRHTFVRLYTRNARKDSALKKFLRTRKTVADETRGFTIDEVAGGEHRHEAEEFLLIPQLGKELSQAATRCTSTAYALTAYFCGDPVASNMDRESEGGPAPLWVGGTDSLEMLIETYMGRGFPPLILRVRFGPEEEDEEDEMLEFSTSHIWNLVFMPDGTFLWLQSFINEYSLGQWMDKSRSLGVNPMSGEELLRRVQLLKQLEESAEGWTPKHDELYYELFGVTLKGNKGKAAARWRGGRAYFDVACEWPVKQEVRASSPRGGDGKGGGQPKREPRSGRDRT